MEYVTLATINKTHGLSGELRCLSQTSFPKERFKAGNKLVLFNPKSEEILPVTVKAARCNGDILLLKFEELDSIEKAENFIHWEIRVSKEDAPLPENNYRIMELIGCEAFDQNGNSIGEIADVVSYSSTSNLKIKTKAKKFFFVPFIDAFVNNVDIENKRLEIEVVPGMLP